MARQSCFEINWPLANVSTFYEPKKQKNQWKWECQDQRSWWAKMGLLKIIALLFLKNIQLVFYIFCHSWSRITKKKPDILKNKEFIPNKIWYIKWAFFSIKYRSFWTGQVNAKNIISINPALMLYWALFNLCSNLN